MKTYNKTSLPESITYKGELYHYNPRITVDIMTHNGVTFRSIGTSLKKEGRKFLVVNVMSKNLKGKTDLYGQPYKPFTAIQFLKHLQCLHYNIEPEHWNLTDQEKADFELLGYTITSCMNSIIHSMQEYKDANYSQPE